MTLDTEYQRRLQSLARAEAGRSGPVAISGIASVALARRMQVPRCERLGAVDPVAASRPDPRPLLLRH
ncbi:hypothetical protein ACFQPG_01090 [Sphingomonas sp. GCM10030256]|uniref:hypothetical protein n=1 Tax=Sphingomonas sp. GCM10030256 TaxID=3273427 RepID=UPI00361755DD